MSDIFISYARVDQPRARRLADALEASGWSVWWDPKIQSGMAFDRVIETAIAEAKCVVVLWSPHSVNSDWVRAEASNGLSRSILISLALEKGLALPLRFTQIHTEDFSGWDGDTGAPEFEKLVSDIRAALAGSGNGQEAKKEAVPPDKRWPVRYLAVAAAGLVLFAFFLYQYLQTIEAVSKTGKGQPVLYLLLTGLAVSALLWGLTNGYFHKKGRRLSLTYKLAIPAAGGLLILLSGFFLPHRRTEADLSIRVLDKQREPVKEGTVALALPQVEEQPISKNGEVKFTGVPVSLLTNKVRISVSSPGFSDHLFDTLIKTGHPLELVLTKPAVIKISGRVEDAGEVPIRDVEISVENTRYYTHSLTDGTFFLNITAYASGDEIILRTSHPRYEDKLVHLAVKSPETQVPDIALKPVN